MKRMWPGTSTNPTTSVPGRQRGEREAEIDREAARLLLGKAVGIGAGEREHQRRLAVVDVAGGRDHPHVASTSSARRTVQQRARRVARRRTGRPCAGRTPPRRRDRARPRRAARRRRSAASTSATATATPADGMVRPGHRAAAGGGFGVDDRRAGNGRRRSRSARSRSSATGVVAMRQSGIAAPSPSRYASATACERGERDLVGAQRTRERMPREPRDEVGAADDDPRLRSAEQLVAREGDERRARVEALAHARARRRATPVARASHGVRLVEEPRSGVDDHRRPERRELARPASPR